MDETHPAGLDGSPDVLALVAPNGLGHLRRVVGVLSRMADRVPNLSIAIACEPGAAASLRSWPRAAALFRRADLYPAVMGPGVSWSRDRSVYDDGRLLSWEDRLSELDALSPAALVISDNLVGALGFRADTVLLGSFLASDVLAAAHPESAAVRAFVDHERVLLAEHRPPMLCVDDIVMPGVVTRTNTIRLPWMCEAPPVPRTVDERRRVAILGGRTGAADELLRDAAAALASAGAELAVPDGAGLEAPGRVPFGFQPADFAALAVAVCRPGMGTVNDCISQGVPMVLVHEGNPELAHNAARLAALGLGEDLGASPEPLEIVAAVGRLLEPACSETIRARMAALPKDGLDRAAGWLVDRLAECRSGRAQHGVAR